MHELARAEILARLWVMCMIVHYTLSSIDPRPYWDLSQRNTVVMTTTLMLDDHLALVSAS